MTFSWMSGPDTARLPWGLHPMLSVKPQGPSSRGPHARPRPRGFSTALFVPGQQVTVSMKGWRRPGGPGLKWQTSSPSAFTDGCSATWLLPDGGCGTGDQWGLGSAAAGQPARGNVGAQSAQKYTSVTPTSRGRGCGWAREERGGGGCGEGRRGRPPRALEVQWSCTLPPKFRSEASVQSPCSFLR